MHFRVSIPGGGGRSALGEKSNQRKVVKTRPATYYTTLCYSLIKCTVLYAHYTYHTNIFNMNVYDIYDMYEIYYIYDIYDIYDKYDIYDMI